MIISFEGVDKVGKSTQISLVSDFLHKEKIQHTVLKEPSNSDVGKKIKNIIKNLKENDPVSLLLLFLTARRELFLNQIKPLQNKNQIILLDRFIDSSIVLQGYFGGIDTNLIEKMNDLVTDTLHLDHTFILDIDEHNLNKHLHEKQIDNIEKDFFKKTSIILKGFRKIAIKHSHRTTLIKYASTEKVFQQILTKIKNILQKNGQYSFS